MPAMPLQAISLLLHGLVGWRLVPALGSVAAGVLLGLILAISALTLPFGLGARRAGKGRRAALLAWVGLVCMGLFSSLFVLSLVRDLVPDRGCGGRRAPAGRDRHRRGRRPVGARGRDRRRAGDVLGLRERTPRRARSTRRGSDRRAAGCARRLHDRAGERRPRRARRSSGPSSRRSSRPSTGSTSISSRSPATSSTARCASSPPTSRRSPGCARRKEASSSPATTSTTRAPRRGCASCAGSGSRC